MSDPNQVGQIAGWDLDIRQLEPGQMRTDLKYRPGQQLSVMGFRLSHKVHQVGESPTGVVTLGLPTSKGLMTWCGNEVDGSGLLGFGDGDELSSVSAAGFSGVTLSISKTALIQIGDDLQIDLPDAVFQSVFRSAAYRTEELHRFV